MKIYFVHNRYYHTQDEAKAAARKHNTRFNPDLDVEEVPTDRKGLIAYLNEVATRPEREEVRALIKEAANGNGSDQPADDFV